MRYVDLEELLKKRSRWGSSACLWKGDQLKEDFREYLNNKCWYTEVPLGGQDVHIDHFRPKAEIKPYETYFFNRSLCNCGYSWLKNEPANYRACCIYANRVTGAGGKGNFFPLKAGSPLLTYGGAEDEEPLLLDPCKREDVVLLTFMGKEVLCSSANEDDKVRVKVSRKIYNMINKYIETDRAKVWEEVTKTWAEYKADEISRSVCLRRLKDAVDREAPFSACAISCVKSIVDEDIKAELDLEL